MPKKKKITEKRISVFNIRESVTCTILLQSEGGRERGDWLSNDDVLHIIMTRRAMSQSALKNPFGVRGLLLT